MTQLKRQAYLIVPIILVLLLSLSVSLTATSGLQKETLPSASATSTTAPAGKASPAVPVSTTYDANVRVDVNNKTTTGTLIVSTKNDTGKPQDAVYFHLYPNTFKDLSKLTGQVWNDVLGKQPKPGRIDITGVKADGKDTAYAVKDTVLEIPLSNWTEGKTANIEIAFTIHIPMNNLRLSYDDNAIWFGNWLPIRAVYDKDGWNLDPYYAIGDPFYSDIADYIVKVTVPENYKIASTGSETKPSAVLGGERTYSFAADQVRDFSMTVMDPIYDSLVGKAGDVTVRTWHRKTDNKERVQFLHDVAIKSIAYFSEKYGAYPYDEYDVVRTGGYFGGMEYPGLVYIQSNYYNDPNPFGAVAVAHETAHQWWYAMVGNNEVKEPWVDESLTNYSTLRFLLDQVPDIGKWELLRRTRDLPNATKFEQMNESVGMPVNQFSQNASYAKLVYTKGPEMFYKLDTTAGTDKINEALRHYFTKFQYKNATGKDLIDSFAAVYGEGVRDYFDAWLHGRTAEYKP